MMMRIVFVLSLCLLLPSAALAEKRVSLVIGNGSYGHQAPLPNVPNDAAAMAALFKVAKFDVVELRAGSEIASRLQRSLRTYGCYHGRVDGIWNEDGQQALALFARENGRELENLDATIENIMQVEGGVTAGCPQAGAISPKAAAKGCAPRAGAQVFSEPNRSRSHPDGASVGTSWSLVDVQIIANATGRYVYGKLYSPRGGYQKWVYGLAEQWDCQ
jgi:hypothetical protein